MTRFERRQMEVTIDYLIELINRSLDSAVTESVLQRYNAVEIWKLSDIASLENVIGTSDDTSAESEILEMAIETLNERQKRIYELHYLQGFTLREVAAILGLSAPTVTGYKQRIEKIIKKFFDDANFSV